MKYQAKILMIAGRGNPEEDFIQIFNIQAETDAMAAAKLVCAVLFQARTAKHFQIALEELAEEEDMHVNGDSSSWIEYLQYNEEEFQILSFVCLDTGKALVAPSKALRELSVTLKF